MPLSRYRYLTLRQEQEVAVLTFTGPQLGAGAVTEALRALGRASAGRVVLDLRDVRRAVGNSTHPEEEPFVPLFKLRRQIQQRGGRLALCNVSAEVQELLRNTWLLGLFEVQADVASAVAALKCAEA